MTVAYRASIGGFVRCIDSLIKAAEHRASVARRKS